MDEAQKETSRIYDQSLKENLIPQPIPPVVRKSLKNGLITEGSISENERPVTTVSESLNMNFDIIGSAQTRLGSVVLGNNLTNPITGMHYLVDTVSPNTNTKTMVVSGTAVYYLAGSTWTSIRTGLTLGSKARFCTFLNFAFMVNGTEATAVWDGVVADGFITTGNASSAPKGTFVENFRGRMWIMGNGTYPSRLYYSSIPSSVTTPVVTWNTDVSTGQWIDISPSDGDFPTALQRFTNVMLVFKTNRIYRVFDISQTDPDPYYMVGTYSQESVVETKTGVFFHHSSGFYQYGTDGSVTEISRPVWDIIKAIPPASYSSVVGWVEKTGDHINWSVGNVTIKGITFTNLIVRYCISTQTWTHSAYPTAFTTSLRRNPLYTDGTTQFNLTGDSSGNVIQMHTGYTDINSTPIYYSLTHGWDTLDGLLSTRKNIQQINFTHYQGAGTVVKYQNEEQDPDDPNSWQQIGDGQFKTINTGFNSVNIKGRKIRFRLTGTNKGTPFIYNGYEIINAIAELIQFT